MTVVITRSGKPPASRPTLVPYQVSLRPDQLDWLYEGAAVLGCSAAALLRCAITEARCSVELDGWDVLRRAEARES